eukprot:UN03448
MSFIFLFISLITYTCLSHVKSQSSIDFKPITHAKYVSASGQEKTNSNILEHAYCKLNTFTDPSTVLPPSYYHWYTQSLTNYTSVTIIHDTLNQYTTPNKALASQLPHQLYYAYTTFDSSVSPITKDIFSCYVVPSCSFGCAFIECNIFSNNAANPSWSDLNFFITSNERSGSFAQKPQVLCMNDGYIVS